MHSDFRAGKNTELHTLTGIVVELGKKHKIATTTYEKVFVELTRRMEV
jgi:2-dehydropantoate 2-reductase